MCDKEYQQILIIISLSTSNIGGYGCSYQFVHFSHMLNFVSLQLPYLVSLHILVQLYPGNIYYGPNIILPDGHYIDTNVTIYYNVSMSLLVTWIWQLYSFIQLCVSST